MAGRYQLKRRAERQEQTRRRIVEAAVALHTTMGPLRTTDAAIAGKAGVTRVTFYRHFPDEVSLFRACTAHGLQTMPPPDPERWRGVDDPEERLRTALRELYAYYHVAGQGLILIGRDMPLLSAEIRALPSRMDVFRTMPAVLTKGWPGGERSRTGAAAIDHALAATTWDSLVQRGGLRDDEAIELLLAMVRCAYGVPCTGEAQT